MSKPESVDGSRASALLSVDHPHAIAIRRLNDAGSHYELADDPLDRGYFDRIVIGPLQYDQYETEDDVSVYLQGWEQADDELRREKRESR